MNMMSRLFAPASARSARLPDVSIRLEARLAGTWITLAVKNGTFNQATKMALKLATYRDAIVRAGSYSAADLRLVETRQPRIKF